MNSLVRGKQIEVTEKYLKVELEDGRIILTPISWYPELSNASKEQQLNFKFICKQTGIEWPELDLHLSIGHMLTENLKEEVA